jgi:ankyrin repeat protein
MIFCLVIVLKRHAFMSNANLNLQLLTACQEGDIERIKSLKDQGANIHSKIYEYGAVETAVRSARLDVLKFLFDNGAKSPNLETAMSWAAKSGNLAIVRYLAQRDVAGKDRALVNACSTGKYYVVKFLLKIGAAMQRFDNAALKQAIKGNYWDVIQLLKREEKRRTEICVDGRFMYFFFVYRPGFCTWRMNRWW